MTQWAEVPSAKPHDLNLSPGTHLLEGKNQLLQDVLCSPHMCNSMHRYAHIPVFICTQAHTCIYAYAKVFSPQNPHQMAHNCL